VATLRASLIEHNHDGGVLVAGADATLEALVVRDTLPRASDQAFGRGVTIQDRLDTLARSNATLRASIIEQNHEVGVVIAGSDAMLEGVVVRNTLPRAADQVLGRGLSIEDTFDTGALARTTVRASIIEQNHDIGVFVAGTETTLEAIVVRDTFTRPADLLFGDGIAVASEVGEAHAVVVASHIGGSERAGLAAFGALVELDASVLSCNAIQLARETHRDRPATFVDGGNNRCLCEDVESPCQALAAGLEPPQPPP
jgi:hypothetical protein